MGVFHIPVMVREVIASLRCRAGALYLDCTVGGGGHAEAILQNTAPDGLLVGIDTDGEAIEAAEKRLAPFRGRAILVKGNFADMDAILTRMNIERADGILIDLGVSSHQLDTADRGFSFTHDAPLDMRMDRSRGRNAYDLIQSLPEAELERILREYGEERMARRIARSIVTKRDTTPVRTTAALAALVIQALPREAARQKIHPATRTFQAFRIAVNDELTGLHRAIADGMERLRPGGRLSVISFHSLEDRIVKNAFRRGEKGCLCPPDLPVCVCGRKPTLKVVNRKPIVPGKEEISDNPRSRSAKLRTAERI